MELLIKLIPLLLYLLTSTIAFIIWLIHLEGTTKNHTEEINNLKTTQKEEIKELKEKIDKMSDKLGELCETVAGLAGFWKGKDCHD